MCTPGPDMRLAGCRSWLIARSGRSRAHQLGSEVVEAVLELRRARPYWGPRWLQLELIRKRRGTPSGDRGPLIMRQASCRRCLAG